MAVPDEDFDIFGDLSPGCIKVGVSAYPPYGYYIDSEQRYAGPFLEFMKVLSDSIGFCYSMHHTKYPFHGNILPNGTWTGYMRKIVRQELDILGPMLAYSSERNGAMDVTPVLKVEPHGMMVQWPKLESDVAGFVKPFNIDVWLFMLATFFIVGISMCLVGYIAEILESRRNGTKYPEFLTEFRKGMMVTVRGTLNQSTTEKLSMGYILTGVWLLTILVVTVVYKGNLKAKLIAPSVNYPFRTLKEFTETPSVDAIMISNTRLPVIMGTAPEGSTYQKTLAKTEFSADVAYILNLVSKGTHTLLLFRVALFGFIQDSFYRTGRCELTVLKDFFVNSLKGFGIGFHCPYREEIKKAMSHLIESGIVDKLVDDSIANGLQCQNPGTDDIGLQPLKLKDIYGVLLLYAEGLALGAISFIFEIIFNKKKKEEEHEN